jgi:ABC-type transport system substrate-binding protein
MQRHIRGLRAGPIIIAVLFVAAACSSAASPSPTAAPATAAPATAAPATAAPATAAPASAAPASAAPAESAAVTPMSGGSITIAVKRDPGTLNPIKDGGIEANYTGLAIRDRLVNPDVDDKASPGLATSWENPSPTTWIFHLRQGVKFSNGAPFTAKDAKYTFDTVMSKDSELAGNWSYIKEAKIVDDFTFELDLKNPYPFLLEQLAQNSDMGIIPDGYMATCGSNCDTTQVGTGPFMVKEWVKGDHLTLVRNPNYWNPPQPYLDSVRYKVVPDPEVQVIQLKTGAADVLYAVPYKDVNDLKANPDVTVYPHSSGTTMCMCMNTLVPPFNDIKVRLAMEVAIDREEIVRTILYGLGSVPTDLLPPWHEAHDPTYPAPVYDPEKAKQMLADAGYTDANPLKFELRTINDPYFIDEATLIQAQLAKIGVNVTVTPMEKAAFLAPMFRVTGTDPKSWQAGLEQYTFGHSTFSFVWEQWAKDSYINTSNINLPGGFQDPEVERLVNLAITTTDPAQAKVIYRQLKEQLDKDAPQVWVTWADNVQAARSRVKDFNDTAQFTYPLNVVWVNDGK